MAWQVQEAKQRFSELLARAEREGPQTVTKHGRPVAVVVDIERYRSMTKNEGDPFLAHLLAIPKGEYHDLFERDRELPRDIDHLFDE